MKKALAFIFSLFIVFAIFPSGTQAMDPVGDNKQVVDDLKEKVMTCTLLDHICPVDRTQLTRSMDEIHGFESKTFKELSHIYAGLLEECFTMGKPVSYCCRVFASYTFEKFRNMGVPCQYLRMKFFKNTDVCGYDNIVSAHGAVLVPQNEYGHTVWYVCDASVAAETHKEKFLFMPLTEYLSFCDTFVENARLHSIGIINEDNERYLGDPEYYRDLTIWFDVMHDNQAVEEVLNWEEQRGRWLSPQSCRKYLREDLERLADLHGGISVSDYAEKV